MYNKDELKVKKLPLDIPFYLYWIYKYFLRKFSYFFYYSNSNKLYT
jgi:hypothetical protein